MGFFDSLKNAASSLIEFETEDDFSTKPQQSASVHGMPAPMAPKKPQEKPQPAPAPKKEQESLYGDTMERLIDVALADGELTEKEKQVLFRKAESMGIDLDEFEMVLDARLYEVTKAKAEAEKKAQPTPPVIPEAAPKSNKFGDIKKCPSCGAIMQSFSVKCPDCGYEFRNVEANCSVQRLFELLNEAENESVSMTESMATMIMGSAAESKLFRRKKAIIQNFPIPNTKGDILEFLTLAVPLAKKPSLFSQNRTPEYLKMCEVWKAKCEQIIMKAKFSMKDDKETLAEIMAYGKEIGLK